MLVTASALVLSSAITALVLWEARTSCLQARYLSHLASGMSYQMAAGPSDAIQFPDPGPYDQRLGYAQLGTFLDRLEDRGFVIEAQARSSAQMLDRLDQGAYAIYHEKAQAGLELLDHDGRQLYSVRYPNRVFGDFDAIPSLVVATLLFLENRELLDDRHPMRNPAVEWDRLALAVWQRAVPMGGGGRSPGGSTLATQLEKFRHSPLGITVSVRDKARQMASASLRAYQDGPDTTAARQGIVVQYIDSIPLAAHPILGEVHGLGDSLWAWYEADLDQTCALLRQIERAPAGASVTAAQALAYKQVLSLFVSQKRPTYYLLRDPRQLELETEAHLRLLARRGVISESLCNAALSTPLEVGGIQELPAQPSMVRRKPSTVARARLAALLGVPGVYDLDRLDLTAWTTLDLPAQNAVLENLLLLTNPTEADAAGLTAHRIIARGDPAGVIYSVSLVEHVGEVNLVRVQVDNYDQPLDINEGVKLELGSTAKLRTLVSYLEIIAELHGELGSRSPEVLRTMQVDPLDKLTVWAVEWLGDHPGSSLQAMLEAAMERKYSASPGETFFTGGGAHKFHNFDNRYSGANLTVRTAFHNSVNLPFVRIMRDVVRYYIFRLPGSSSLVLQDAADPARRRYLERFADEEGKEFLRRFWKRYQGVPQDRHLAEMTASRTMTPMRLAVAFRSVRPGASLESFQEFVAEQLPLTSLSDNTVNKLYETYPVERFDLVDRGYLAGIHPLELWLVAWLQERPAAGFDEAVAASVAERQQVYGWLFRSKRKRAQDIRIRTMLEMEAFTEIHRRWARLGYPFESLVPSYATAIGSSGDRPAALAELAGIIVNDGLLCPAERIEGLHFAEGTPYETALVRGEKTCDRVMAPEVAATLRKAMIGVVEEGTAKRVRGAFVLRDGTELPVGGKTGTGDNRHKIYGSRSEVTETRVLNRTATFVFFIGDRFFGTVVAYVPGEAAGGYRFTSALPAQVLEDLAPDLLPVIQRAYDEGSPTDGSKEP